MHLELLLVITAVIITMTNGHVKFATNIRSSFPQSNNIYWQHHQNVPLKSSIKMPKFKQSFSHSSMPNGQSFSHTMPNGQEMQFSLKHNVFRQKPRSKPKPKPAPVEEQAQSPPAQAQSPPAASPAIPEDNIEAWDKNILIQHVIAAYKDSCKKSDIVIFPSETKHKLVSSAKKMPLAVNDFHWVMNVEMFCTLNFWPVHSCFTMPLEDGFKKALNIHGIKFTDNSGTHGSVCSLIRKIESDQLEESRKVNDDELKNKLANILIDDFHKSRSLPHPSESFMISFPLKGAKDAYWTLVTKIEQFSKHFTRQAVDFCMAFHSDDQLFDHFVKFTAGTEKTKLDDAFRNLIRVMSTLPLEKENEKERSEENCTYNLFLFRVELEFFLALDKAIIEWLSKYGYPDHEHFCPVWREHCLYDKIRQQIRGTKKITEELIKNLHGWFDGRTHGRINEDFDYFVKTYVSDRFRIKISPPPKPAMQFKYKFKNGGITNKVLYDNYGRNMRIQTKISHPNGGSKMIEHETYMPMENPNNFSMQHPFNHFTGGSEEGDNETEHEDNEEHDEQGMHEDNSDEGDMHAKMEMNHEYEQYHPYGGIPESHSYEISHDVIKDKKGQTRNVMNNRCRIGQNHMNFQFGYDPECMA